MRKPFSIIVIIAAAVAVCLPAKAAGDTRSWQDAWANPGVEHRPWTFWYWMYGCVSDAGIRADLQAMADAGIAGFYLMPIKDTSDAEQYGGTARQLSDDWWRRMDTVFSVADSLGLQMGIHFCDGFALGGGPWIDAGESMQRVVWRDTVVAGGGNVSFDIAKPKHKEGYYEDIATFAYPAAFTSRQEAHCNVDFPLRSSEPIDIVMSYDEPFTLRSVQVITGGNNYQAHRLKVFASNDSVNYRFIREIKPARQGWQNTDAYATYAIPATTARYFKFHWTPEGSDPGSEDMDAAKWKPNLRMANLVLSSEPIIDGYEGKSGAVWRVSKAYSTDSAACVPLSDIIDISSCLSGDHIETRLPGKGMWHVLRMGHTSTGHTNATGGGGRGLECDKFSRAAIRKQFDNWFAAIYNHADKATARRVLTRLHIDSWECGSQNWGEGFAEQFLQRRGYDIRQWLPVYAGVPVETSAKSEAVLRDIRTTIMELIDEVFFDEFEKLGKQYGCLISAESVAPTMVSDGMLHYRHADYPMGEFWLNSPTHDKPNDMLDAISGAHIYGKKIIQAEGFTEVRGTWDEHPGMLKALLDRNFCLGINSIVFHVNTHNPWMDKAPGMTLDGIGTFFQRDNTWWRCGMPAFTAYITRCQALLQYGSPVVDLAVYTGDEAPRRAILPERLTETLPGLMGSATLERERQRMANVGQPLEVSPVGVTHTANMTKAEQWTNSLHGYKYDSMNRDALDQSAAAGGRIVTAAGMSYGALVLPQARPMNPDRIMTCDSIVNSLQAQGARIIDGPWTDGDMSRIGIMPDAILPDGIDFAHRHAADADIYFISNQTDSTVTFAPRFRNTRSFCCIADPLTGAVYEVADSITMDSHASLFYVYTDEKAVGVGHRATTVVSEQALDGCEWTITFEKTGKTMVTTSLKDWTEYDDPQVKYYSGQASYETIFTRKSHTKDSQTRTLLRMENVNNIATVYVNGKPCGTSWTSLHEIDITDALVKGTNTLRIDVTNTWANALLGNDLGTPPFDGIWTNGKYRRAEKTPLPAGLTGTITLTTVNGGL